MFQLQQKTKRTIFFIAMVLSIVYSVSAARDFLEPYMGFEIFGQITVGLVVSALAMWGAWLAYKTNL